MSAWNLFPPARERCHARYHPRDIHAHVHVFSSLYYPWGNWKPGRSVLSGYSWAQFPYYDRNPKAYSQRPVIPYVQVGWRQVEKVEVPGHTVLFTFFLFSSMYSIFPRHGNTKIFSCRSQSAKPQNIVKPDLRIEYHNTKYLAWIYVCQVTSYDDRHILELWNRCHLIDRDHL